jgi:3-oxoacyl-[acyl-carrier protein] reductase
MDLELKGRAAMVAAASKGIGRAAAESLAREGCRVSIFSRDARELEKTRKDLEALPSAGQALAVAGDVTKSSDLENWFEKTSAAFGAVDILVTNTGGPPAARFLDLTENQWNIGLDLTLKSVLRLSRLVIPGMQARRWGRIVHLTSFVAKQPMDLLTVSSTLRAGLSALTKTMANQLAADNILVNAVLPGYTSTQRQIELNEIRASQLGIPVEQYAARSYEGIPLGRAATPREIGDVVAFLASERASYLTGSSIQVDGGLVQATF